MREKENRAAPTTQRAAEMEVRGAKHDAVRKTQRCRQLPLPELRDGRGTALGGPPLLHHCP